MSMEVTSDAQPQFKVSLSNDEETITNTKRKMEVSSCFTSMMLAGVVLGFMGPIYPQEAEKRHLQPSEYALVFSMYGITGLLSSIFVPVVIGKVGPKSGIIIGLVMNGVAVATMGALFYVENKELFLIVSLVSRSVTGIAQILITGGVPTLITTNYREGGGLYVSLMQSGFSVGAGVGPLLGGLLYEIESFLLPFEFIGGSLIFMALVSGYTLRKKEPKPNDTAILKTLSNTGSMLKISDIWVGIGSISYVIAVETYLITTLEPHLRGFQISGSAVGGFFLLMFGAYSFSSPIWGKACDNNIPPYYCNILGCLLIPLGMAFIGPLPWVSMNPSMWMVVLSMLLIGVGIGANMGPSMIHIKEVALLNEYPDTLQTNAMVAALFSCAISFSGIIGPLMGGILIERFGFRKSTLSGIILGFLIPIFIIFESCRTKKKSPRKSSAVDNVTFTRDEITISK